ncbi:MAG: NAD(P)/FAD-dependent oxidoreductase [Oscillospiraceae bacterium]|nr:NAD(P)/FAD-dependent oxidoreductase [Oscillospiraceae bacterium]
MKMIDVLIIGCGIAGVCAAYELSRYNLSVTAVDRLNDIAAETSRANSGIVHAGYDPLPGSLMAKFNVRGNELMGELCKKLDVPFKRNGALVLGFDESDEEIIDRLYRQGLKSGVPVVEILSRQEALKLEPNLSPDLICALHAPGSGIVSPWELAIALAETAARNGVNFSLSTEVTAISRTKEGYIVKTDKGSFNTRAVVNAAGLYCDIVHGYLKEPDFKVMPSRGQYYLLDKSSSGIVARTVFRCPDKSGKGALVSPTVHGNLLVGPSSEGVSLREDTSTDDQTLGNVLKACRKLVPTLEVRDNIRTFAGVRAVTDVDDFIIRESEKNFFDLAGLKSPGLASAPAIAEELIRLMEVSGLELSYKENFADRREVVRFRYLDSGQKAEIIRQNPSYGRIICRCESITEGEILDAFNSPIPPATVDAIKRRCHAGMGRCQGGFCAPKVISLITKHFGTDPRDVLKGPQGSYIITGEKGLEGRS